MKVTRLKKKTVVFALVRGYEEKWKYGSLVLRNLFLRLLLLRSGAYSHTEMVLFHEGNITSRDQGMLRLLSCGPLRFVDVSRVFTRAAHHVWTRHGESEGYSLMCKFNYFDVWPLIGDYQRAIRVDEDCLILSIPTLGDEEIFTTGLASAESHEPTNRTLLPYLREINLATFYDHNFPYTNVYSTSPSFWLRADVQSYLKKIWLHPDSVNERWGDLPVLGVALRAFGGCDHQVFVNPGYNYIHLSHLTFVGAGK